METKSEYIKQFKRLYRQKNYAELSDDLACEYFEKLIALVSAITGHLSPKDIIIPKHGESQKTKQS
ncbi:MAG: hypothetical protein WCV79_02950 [Candidatus Paceibacterota bacterium]